VKRSGDRRIVSVMSLVRLAGTLAVAGAAVAASFGVRPSLAAEPKAGEPAHGPAAAVPAPVPAAKGAELYPLDVGATWDYKVEGSRRTAKVVRHDVVGADPVAVIEVSRDGVVVSSELLAARSDGVYRIGFGGEMLDKPLPILKFPVKKGDTWTATGKVLDKPATLTFTVDAGDAKVPAGEFKAAPVVVVKAESDGRVITQRITYAPGVGPVLQVFTEGNRTVTIELEKYTPGKGPAVPTAPEKK
jgi:hypothetical protein